MITLDDVAGPRWDERLSGIYLQGALLTLHLCRIYASVTRVGIGSDHGLSPIRRQAIFLTNAGLLSLDP